VENMNLKVNQNIVVNVEVEDQSFQSIVAEITDKEIFISLPLEGIVIRNLPVNTSISVYFSTGDNQYKFSSAIVGKISDNIPLYRIVKPQPKDMIKVQRRDNFRVKTNLSLKLNDHDLITLNISAGGLLCSCSKDLMLKINDSVKGILFLPPIENKAIDPIHFQGEIKRVSQMDHPDKMYVALEFGRLNDRDQMNLVQYCFYKQKQNRLIEQN
jgi:c-di-GMP-binding flagellar brake protein YcgR